jgi:hypothetical protein
VRDRAGALKQNDLFAGQKIAVNHFLCSTRGHLFTSKGKTSENEMYCGGCVFVDHATGHLHMEFQKHLNTHETLEAKESFELMCCDHGVIPQAYHSDNGSSFTSSGCTQDLLHEFAQVTSFAGDRAGAHHHNGTSERAIQTIMNMSHTMMLHAALHWPDVADLTLCPWQLRMQFICTITCKHWTLEYHLQTCLPKCDGNSRSFMMNGNTCLVNQLTNIHLMMMPMADTEFLGLEPLTSSHSSHSSPTKRSLSRCENVARAIDNACPPIPPTRANQQPVFPPIHHSTRERKSRAP